MFLPLSQAAGKPKQVIGRDPNGHIAASACFCSRKILKNQSILSKQSDKPWTCDAERTCTLLDGPGLNPRFSRFLCHTGPEDRWLRIRSSSSETQTRFGYFSPQKGIYLRAAIKNVG